MPGSPPAGAVTAGDGIVGVGGDEAVPACGLNAPMTPRMNNAIASLITARSQAEAPSDPGSAPAPRPGRWRAPLPAPRRAGHRSGPRRAAADRNRSPGAAEAERER